MTDNKPVKDGMYCDVQGTVGRVNDGRFVIEVKNERSQYPDRVTVWKPEFTVVEGDRVAVRGWMSWKRTERDGKIYFDVSLNVPKLTQHEPAAPAAYQPGDDGSPF